MDNELTEYIGELEAIIDNLVETLEESLATAHLRLGHAAPGYDTCKAGHCIQTYAVIKRARANP